VRHICNTDQDSHRATAPQELAIDLCRDQQPISFTKLEPEPIIWPVLFTLSGQVTDHLFETATSPDSPELERCRSKRSTRPDNSNRVSHLMGTT